MLQLLELLLEMDDASYGDAVGEKRPPRLALADGYYSSLLPRRPPTGRFDTNCQPFD